MRAISSVPPMLSRVTARQPFGSIASAGTKYCPPALLTSTSSRPQRSSAKRTIRSASCDLADVARDGVRAQLRRGLAEHVLAPAGDHDLGAAGPQLRRRGAAEPGAAAGDERDAAVEHPGGEDLRGHHRADKRIGLGYGVAPSGNNRIMGIPGVHIETVHNPIRYTYAQIEQACKVAAALGPRQADPRGASSPLARDDDPGGEASSPPASSRARSRSRASDPDRGWTTAVRGPARARPRPPAAAAARRCSRCARSRSRSARRAPGARRRGAQADARAVAQDRDDAGAASPQLGSRTSSAQPRAPVAALEPPVASRSCVGVKRCDVTARKRPAVSVPRARRS